MKLILVAVTVLLAACNHSQQTVPDQCLRAEIFKTCLQMIPKGPDSVHNSNDWSEVVAECANIAYYQSLRPAEIISRECRAYHI